MSFISLVDPSEDAIATADRFCCVIGRDTTPAQYTKVTYPYATKPTYGTAHGSSYSAHGAHGHH